MFSPEELERKRFSAAHDGYDKREVESFLEAVADDYRQVLQHAKVTSDALAETRADLERVTRLGDAVTSLVGLTEFTAEIRAAAEQQAAEIRASAEQQVSQLWDEVWKEVWKELEEARELRAAAERDAVASEEAIRRDRQAARRELEAATLERRIAVTLRMSAERGAADIRSAVVAHFAQLHELLTGGVGNSAPEERRASLGQPGHPEVHSPPQLLTAVHEYGVAKPDPQAAGTFLPNE